MSSSVPENDAHDEKDEDEEEEEDEADQEEGEEVEDENEDSDEGDDQPWQVTKIACRQRPGIVRHCQDQSRSLRENRDRTSQAARLG